MSERSTRPVSRRELVRRGAVGLAGVAAASQALRAAERGLASPLSPQDAHESPPTPWDGAR